MTKGFPICFKIRLLVLFEQIVWQYKRQGSMNKKIRHMFLGFDCAVIREKQMVYRIYLL